MPIGFFLYHQVGYYKILHCSRFALSVLDESQNRQRPLLRHILTTFYNRVVKCLQRGTD
jgi:hypothetical protein